LGAYVLERKLGTGGMAEVFLARRSGPHGFSKRVAIKKILPELARDPQLIQMFCDEARLAASLNHPNIAQVLEFGEQDGELYLVMEHVDGVSCSTLLRAVSERGETIPTGPALVIARDVLLALGFAHEATDEDGLPLGVVHRDVSPSNILVSRIGTVKLIDFGITRSFIAERRTFPGELKGKLRYMSPEQILGADVDARSDLFAAGIVLAEMLAGRALFSGRSDLDILTRISRGELGIVRDGKIAPDLAVVLEKALAHRPGDRFQTAREFAHAIDDVARARGIRLDDSTLVPQLHALGVLPSSSGTRPLSRMNDPKLAAFLGVTVPAGRADAADDSDRSAILRPPKGTLPPSVARPLVVESAPESGPPSLTSPDAPRARFDSGERPSSDPTASPKVDAAELVSEAAASSEPVPPSHPGQSRPSPPARASGTYRLRTRSGKMVGPFRRSEMLALLATGRLSARSHVALSSDSFVPANAVPALAALAAHPAYRFRDDDATSPEWLERIDAATIPTILYSLVLSKKTGLLVAVDGKRRKRVFLDRGDPVFVASTDRDELLGQRLKASGAISERILEFALASQPPFRVGEALVSFGAIGAAQLVRELAKQLEDRLIDLGRWRSGELRFFPDVTLDENKQVRARESTLALMARLVREAFPPGDIAGLLRPVTKEALATSPTYDQFASQLELTPGEAAVLNLAEDSSTVREAVSRASEGGIAMAEALRAVFIGLCSGALVAPGWPPRSEAVSSRAG
jgi:serine/threonine-protein kinase